MQKLQTLAVEQDIPPTTDLVEKTLRLKRPQAGARIGRSPDHVTAHLPSYLLSLTSTSSRCLVLFCCAPGLCFTLFKTSSGQQYAVFHDTSHIANHTFPDMHLLHASEEPWHGLPAHPRPPPPTQVSTSWIGTCTSASGRLSAHRDACERGERPKSRGS